jgi:hypothetical protein
VSVVCCLCYIKKYADSGTRMNIVYPINSGLVTVLSQPGQFSAFGNSLFSFFNHEWKTEKCHEWANMGKVKRLELWWQLYITWLPVRNLENFKPIDFCSRVYIWNKNNAFYNMFQHTSCHE